MFTRRKGAGVIRVSGAGFAALAAAGALLSGSAFAGPLVTNGSFTNSTAYVTEGSGQNQYIVGTNINNSDLSGWTVGTCQLNCGQGANHLFMFLAAPNYGTYGVLNDGQAPINFYTTPGASPDGGNAIAVDAGNEVGALQQTITGLVVGHEYQVSFYQATIQAVDVNATTSFSANWLVSLGGGTAQTSPTMVNTYKSDTPWELVSMEFEATSTSEMLSFLASSPNGGEPPFLLLDGVSLTDVSEPGSVAMLLAGAAGLLAMRRRRQA